MKRSKLVIVAILLALMLTSCEIAFDKATEPGDIWYVGFGADHKNTELRELDYTVKDAIDIGKAFKALADKAGMGFKDIYFLNDKIPSEMVGKPNVHNCTWEDYQTYVNEEIKPKGNDIVICFFSGHGGPAGVINKEYGSLFYFKNKEIAFYDKNNMTKSEGISYEKVYNFIDNLAGSHFIICDTCYSGSFVKPDGVSVDRNTYKDFAPIRLLFEDKVNQSSKTWVLAACTLKQESTEPDEDPYPFFHGGLTYFVLKGLGWNNQKSELGNILAKDGFYVSAGSISRYVYKNGGRYTYYSNHQDPVFGAGSSDLILFKF